MKSYYLIGRNQVTINFPNRYYLCLGIISSLENVAELVIRGHFLYYRSLMLPH